MAVLKLLVDTALSVRDVHLEFDCVDPWLAQCINVRMGHCNTSGVGLANSAIM